MPSKKSVQYLLESGREEDLIRAKKKTEALIAYQWQAYTELAYQRSLIKDELAYALMQGSRAHDFHKYQRAVKYKYGLHPLSTVGSLTYIGGRFNIGKNVNSEIPFFSGLYLAEDKDTALQEHLGQHAVSKSSPLNAREIALSNPTSETIVSVSGKIDRVFDLTTVDNLKDFIRLIRGFYFSKNLIERAKKLNISPQGIVKTPLQLVDSLMSNNWREMPSLYDVASNSQIFGHLVYLAGIEGILYPSKFTKKPCLILFPGNFQNTDSVIWLDDDVPHPKVPNRLDRSNWRMSELSTEEILAF